MTKTRSRLVPQMPILGITGINGAGKTLLAVELAIGDMRAGRPVYSTVDIASEHGDSRPVKSRSHLLQLQDCTVLLDEIAVIFSSSAGSGQNLPSEVVTFLQTLRHRGVSVIWTAPTWKRAHILLREVTQAVATIRPLIKRAEEDSLWGRPFISAVGVLDTTSVAVDAAPDRVLRRRLWMPMRSDALGCYDTHADTPQIGRLIPSGPCPDCGGTRTPPKCAPEIHEALGLDAPVDRLAVARGEILHTSEQKVA